jgi:excisionase family DNA binding protein
MEQVCSTGFMCNVSLGEEIVESVREVTMTSRLARSSEESCSADLPELLTREALGKKTAGLADSLEGKSQALLVTDVAELLSISERQVYKLVAAHRIPSFKIGGSIRFDPFAISTWLRQKMSPSSVEDHRERRART